MPTTPRRSSTPFATTLAALCAVLLAAGLPARAQETAPVPAQRPRVFDINEFQVEGSNQLSDLEVESALLPFLGAGRELADVEKARAALEKLYLDKGYQTVSVAIPPQTVREGVVVLKVAEGTVGRLRVRGAHWFSPRDVKRQAPSVAQGRVPNFEEIARDIVLLNQLPDRRVTPSLRAGSLPGTVDVDLLVQDHLPLHGSVEANNRHGRGTTPVRTSAALRYDNLWQLGHSLSVSYQLAPSRADDGRVFTASYLARFPDLPWLTLSANYLNQHSDVSTVGGINVAGTGQMAGGRIAIALPSTPSFFHTVSTGIDYKYFVQLLRFSPQESTPGSSDSTPLTTWPVTVQYSALLSRERSETQFTAGLSFNLRSVSSRVVRFEDRRFNSRGAFIYYRGELAHTHELPLDLQLFARAQGQYTNDPLVVAEQFSAGGADSVRGYYDSEAVGDFGAVGTVELRSPPLAKLFPAGIVDEWRVHGFFDAGWLGIFDPLPEQQKRFRLASTGAGFRMKLLGHLSGELEWALPLRSEGFTNRYKGRVHFRLGTAF